MAEGVAAGDRETTRDVKGQGRTRAEPMTHHPRSMGDSTRIRRDFEEDNSRSVETNELTDSLFRPRLHQCDSRGIKPRMQSRQEKAKQLPANTASLPQAEALYDPPSSRSLSSVAHDEVESGIDSTAEIDPPLSIHPDKVKIKTNTKLVINIPKQSGKETPAGGCLVKFSRCNLTAKAMAARGNNPNMAQVITPEWPVPGEVTVTLYTKTANEKCIIGKGTVTFYPEGEKVTAPRLFVFDSVHKMTPQHIKAVLEGALLSGIEPSLEAPASSTLELHSETNIFVCLQDNSKIIQAYSHYIYVHFPECGLPCADLTLPELRARLGHLVRVISGGNNEGSNDKRQGGSVSYVTETVESVEDAPLYTAVAGAASEGSTDETIYDCPRDETVPLIIVGDSVVSRISPTSLLAEREVKRSRVDTTSNGLCIDTKLDMSSETALRLISRFMAGQMSQNRVVEDALDYVRFKRASQKKSKKWKVNASFARRRKGKMEDFAKLFREKALLQRQKSTCRLSHQQILILSIADGSLQKHASILRKRIAVAVAMQISAPAQVMKLRTSLQSENLKVCQNHLQNFAQQSQA
eukprot:m.35737 g.35737  ORF g.35737 m.35737 type:complete len:579 (+) comp32168_c0_seq4:69-1805(+)